MKQKDKYKNRSLKDKERLFKWFKSQQRWHEEQPQSAWHKSQARWHKKNAGWLFTFSEILSLTLRGHSSAAANNVQKHNSIISWILSVAE